MGMLQQIEYWCFPKYSLLSQGCAFFGLDDWLHSWALPNNAFDGHSFFGRGMNGQLNFTGAPRTNRFDNFVLSECFDVRRWWKFVWTSPSKWAGVDGLWLRNEGRSKAESKLKVLIMAGSDNRCYDGRIPNCIWALISTLSQEKSKMKFIHDIMRLPNSTLPDQG